MAYVVYILYSESLDKFYKGQTNSIEDRLKRHNAGYETATRFGTPWKLLWVTEKTTRVEALGLESKLKNLSRKRLIGFMNKFKKDCVDPDLLKKFES